MIFFYYLLSAYLFYCIFWSRLLVLYLNGAKSEIVSKNVNDLVYRFVESTILNGIVSLRHILSTPLSRLARY